MTTSPLIVFITRVEQTDDDRIFWAFFGEHASHKVLLTTKGQETSDLGKCSVAVLRGDQQKGDIFPFLLEQIKQERVLIPIMHERDDIKARLEELCRLVQPTAEEGLCQVQGLNWQQCSMSYPEGSKGCTSTVDACKLGYELVQLGAAYRMGMCDLFDEQLKRFQKAAKDAVTSSSETALVGKMQPCVSKRFDVPSLMPSVIALQIARMAGAKFGAMILDIERCKSNSNCVQIMKTRWEDEGPRAIHNLKAAVCRHDKPSEWLSPGDPKALHEIVQLLIHPESSPCTKQVQLLIDLVSERPTSQIAAFNRLCVCLANLQEYTDVSKVIADLVTIDTEALRQWLGQLLAALTHVDREPEA